RAATTATSLETKRESSNIHKTRSKITLNEPSPQVTSSGSGPRCQDTTLGDADAQTRFETTSKQFHDPPLLKVNTSGSGEDSMAHHDDLMDFVPPTPYDSPLSGGHTPRSDEDCLRLRLEKKQRARTSGMNLFKIAMENVKGDIVNAVIGVSASSASFTTVGVSISTVEPRTPLTTTTKALEDEDVTIAQTLVKIRKFDDVQARMDADALLAVKLQEEEREQFSIDEQARFLVDIITEWKRFFAAQRAEQIRNKPPTKAQLRNKMITYLKNMGSFTYNQLKKKSLEEIQKLYEKEQKWINDFVHMDLEVVKDSGKKDDNSQKQAESIKKRPRAEHDEESVKKQKLGGDTKKRSLELVWM
nr:hypothetical protein [Tanacetum cinerariifolium]